MKLTYQQLAELTGKHKNTIINRLNASTLTCEDLGAGKKKLWESSDALKVIYELEIRQTGFSQPGAGTDGEVIDYNAERARAEKARADKLELDNAERLKKLLPAESVEKAWVTMITNTKTKLTGLPSKVSALTDDPDERRRIFTEAKTIVDESLMELARGVE